MKTRILPFLLLLLMAATMQAQTVQFNIDPLPEGTEATAGAAKLLETRLKQILTRNSAGAAQEQNVFAIRPEISILEKKTTSGLIENLTLVKGELTLVALNRVDGCLYHSVTIPVSGQAKVTDDPYKAMIQGIKSTDPQFSRFIRIAREKIDTYYAENCGVIMQKAQSLYKMKKYKEARSYLSAISETIPCYDMASELLAQIPAEDPEPEIVVVERVVEKPVVVEKTVVQRDTVVVEKEVVQRDTVVVEKPVVAEKPVVVETPVKVEEPKPEYTITISEPYLEFKVLSCTGNKINKRITIKTELKRTDSGNYYTEFSFYRAYNQDGESAGSCNGGCDRDFPPELNIKHEFSISDSNPSVTLLSLLGFKIRGAYIEVRNLPVKWE